MSTALQIDSTCLRTLQNDASHKLTRRSIEALYTILEDNSENRSMLQKIGVPFLNSEETLIIPGENAAQISRFSKVPLYPLFTNGELVLNDPLHRQLLSTLIQSVSLTSMPPCTSISSTTSMPWASASSTGLRGVP